MDDTDRQSFGSPCQKLDPVPLDSFEVAKNRPSTYMTMAMIHTLPEQIRASNSAILLPCALFNFQEEERMLKKRPPVT